MWPFTGKKDKTNVEVQPNTDSAMMAVSKSEKRKCTDLLCVLLFVVLWVGMIIVVVNGYANGDPDRLVYALDYKYDQCNRDNSAAARGLDSLDITLKDAEGADRKLKLGGRNHEQADLYYLIGAGPPRFNAKYFGVCQSECPNAGLNEIGYKPDEWCASSVASRPSIMRSLASATTSPCGSPRCLTALRCQSNVQGLYRQVLRHRQQARPLTRQDSQCDAVLKGWH